MAEEAVRPMSDNKGFEPFIDWNAVSQEMADDLHTRVVAYHKANRSSRSSTRLRTPPPCSSSSTS
jgi:hypothetical protein